MRIAPPTRCAVVRDVIGGVEVAHKFLGKDQHALFRREVAALKRVRSDYVVRLVHEEAAPDGYHIFTEFAAHGEMRRPSPHALPRLMRDALRGLRDVHAAGVTHGDVKTSNIVFRAHDDGLKLIDFGDCHFEDGELSKLNKPSYQLRGTATYMAPETLRSCYGPASDVWGLGVTCFRALTGRLPFDAAFATVVWTLVCERQPNYDGVRDADARDFVQRCLEKDPRERATVDELLAHDWLTTAK